VSGIENAKLHAPRDERDLVLANDRVPVEYIRRALDSADTILLQGFAHAALDLRDSSIEGTLLQVSSPTTSIVRVPLRFRNTHIKPRIAMPNVTFEEEVSFHNVILCQELDLAGSAAIASSKRLTCWTA